MRYSKPNIAQPSKMSAPTFTESGMIQGENWKMDNAPIEGCIGCQTAAGRWGCPIHSPNVYVLEPTINSYPGDGMGGEVSQSEEEKKWEEEARKSIKKHFKIDPYGAFTIGYLQACRKRNGESQKEIERLKDEMKGMIKFIPRDITKIGWTSTY